MSAWPLGLSEVLAQDGGLFGVREVRQPVQLSLARQTGFVWSEPSGLVALSTTRKYLAIAAANPSVVAIIVPPGLDEPVAEGQALIVAEKPDDLYHHLHLQQVFPTGPDVLEIDPGASVDPSAVLRGHVRIGSGTRVGPGTVISGPASIGCGVDIDARCVVGCDGLYTKAVLGVRRHMPHFGGVQIGDSVRILAGAVIVRSAVHGESTRIGARACVGVLSNIGHDATVAEDATISSNVVVAGRATIGARAWIGASATISNMVDIGESANVRLGSVVLQDVPPGGDVSGNFARSHAANMRRFLEDIRK
jgi:acyl-[acyl carrier protein]--UDP-N-acetylglucosamine O-acyltransferase